MGRCENVIIFNCKLNEKCALCGRIKVQRAKTVCVEYLEICHLFFSLLYFHNKMNALFINNMNIVSN